ncbi:hypothetical protein V1508DRAFT_398145 [Lipomyces doorenjongii]|uniref:uncharacterized protein n=1 Tax=Lipomyces doorenjongii TaxID=383834 RepID=UPI0034CE420E
MHDGNEWVWFDFLRIMEFALRVPRTTKSHIHAGEMSTAEEVSEWMVKLQDMGQYHNISFVTPEHVVPIVVKAIAKRGLWD